LTDSQILISPFRHTKKVPSKIVAFEFGAESQRSHRLTQKLWGGASQKLLVLYSSCFNWRKIQILINFSFHPFFSTWRLLFYWCQLNWHAPVDWRH
jgi:hypothetical protein